VTFGHGLDPTYCRNLYSKGMARSARAAGDPLGAIEELVCQADGLPVDLLRFDSAATTLVVFLKGRLVERVVSGSCSWYHT